jgi:tRNA threonylcarbamoyladenosine biosynthesis protein TsaB
MAGQPHDQRRALNVLAFDTSTQQAVLAIGRVDGSTFSAFPDPGHRHGRSLVPAVSDLLRQAGLSLNGLDAIAVGLGPGSYTGLRIGLTAAKTWAYARGLHLVGLDSLEVVAQNAPAEINHVAAIADAQRGDVFVAEFVRGDQPGALIRAAPTRVERAEVWLPSLQPGTLVIGPGATQPNLRVPPGVVVADFQAGQPVPQHLLALAQESVRRGQFADPWLLEPTYLRRSSAEDLWEKT